MKRFRYRLEGLKNYHETRERDLLREVEERRADVRRQSEALGALHGQIAALQQQLERGDPMMFMAIISNLEAMGNEAGGRQLELEQARALCERTQAALVEQMRERKKLERHKARGEELHMRLQASREIAESDDLTSSRHRRAE